MQSLGTYCVYKTWNQGTHLSPKDEEGEVIEESCVVITDGTGDELPHYGVDDLNLLVVPLVQQAHSQPHLEEEVVACNMQLYS